MVISLQVDLLYTAFRNLPVEEYSVALDHLHSLLERLGVYIVNIYKLCVHFITLTVFLFGNIMYFYNIYKNR